MLLLPIKIKDNLKNLWKYWKFLDSSQLDISIVLEQTTWFNPTPNCHFLTVSSEIILQVWNWERSSFQVLHPLNLYGDNQSALQVNSFRLSVCWVVSKKYCRLFLVFFIHSLFWGLWSNKEEQLYGFICFTFDMQHKSAPQLTFERGWSREWIVWITSWRGSGGCWWLWVWGLLDVDLNIARKNRLVITKPKYIFKDAFMACPPYCNINTP